MIVCHCKVVSNTAIGEAVANGATSLAEVCRATGAGSDCGCCVFSVKGFTLEYVAQAPRRMSSAAKPGDEETFSAAS